MSQAESDRAGRQQVQGAVYPAGPGGLHSADGRGNGHRVAGVSVLLNTSTSCAQVSLNGILAVGLTFVI
jgi:hypothetical protein